jgi:opacity protein-like surface antigen
MSDINTKQLIQSVQETPSQGAIINGGQSPTSSTTPPKGQGAIINGGQSPTSSTTPPNGQGDTGATDTSKPNPAGNVKDSKKIVSKTGSGVKYDITPDTFKKLEYNYEYQTTKPQDTDSTPVKITSHKIKAGVGYRIL